jgi:hypothetical protein
MDVPSRLELEGSYQALGQSDDRPPHGNGNHPFTQGKVDVDEIKRSIDKNFKTLRRAA